MGGEATGLFRSKTPRLPNCGIETGSQVGELIIHYKEGDPAFFRMERKQRGDGEVSVIALDREVGFSLPLVGILAKRREKITRENGFELYSKWFSIILRCFLCSLKYNPISPILSPSKSEFLSLKNPKGGL